MKLWVCVIPDNEILGVFSTQELCQRAIGELQRTSSYCAIWDLQPQEVELDAYATDRALSEHPTSSR
jgi:hypothetical protein